MPSPVELLPAGYPSLARDEAPAPAGTLFVLGASGGVRVDPASGFTIVFGRNEPEVHVPLGIGDGQVSRRQGSVYRRGDRWVVRNLGRLPLQLPGPQLVLAGHEDLLPEGYTPLFVRSAPRREHLLEIRVAGPPPVAGQAAPDEVTEAPARWSLSTLEHLVLVVLGQRYLRHERGAQPVTWKAVAEELIELQPDAGWSAKRAEHLASGVRTRMARRVAGLTREEVGEPVGNTLNHRMLLELLATATLVPPDLARLGEDAEEAWS